MKKIYYILLYMLAAVITTACTHEEEDLFDSSSAVRADAAVKADLEVLTGAKNGWLLQYYPQAQKSYGGYNILLSFNEDGTVEVAGENAAPDEVVKSLFSVKQSAGVMLSFDTYNDIFHFFSDPSDPAGAGGNGSGMEGDFDFLILEATPEKVVLKGKKTGVVLSMTPLAEGVVWKDLLGSVNKADELLSGFVAYEYTEGDFNAIAFVSYRNLSITYTENDNSVTVKAPYIITSEGKIKFYEPLVLNGKTIDELEYKPDEQYGTLVPTNGVTGAFAPIFPLNYQLTHGDWYFAMSGLGDPQAVARWNAIKTQVMPMLKVPLDYVLFTPVDATTTAFYWSCGGTVGYLFFNNITNGLDEITFDFASQGNNFGVTLWTNYSWSYMVYPFNGVTFKLTADNDENPTVITMTDVADPVNTIKLYKEEILDPFNK